MRFSWFKGVDLLSTHSSRCQINLWWQCVSPKKIQEIQAFVISYQNDRKWKETPEETFLCLSIQTKRYLLANGGGWIHRYVDSWKDGLSYVFFFSLQDDDEEERPRRILKRAIEFIGTWLLPLVLEYLSRRSNDAESRYAKGEGSNWLFFHYFSYALTETRLVMYRERVIW